MQNSNRRRRPRRPRRARLAVDQHVNFSEKFLDDILKGQTVAVDRELPIGTEQKGRAYKCTLCEVVCGSIKDINTHISGRPHRHKALIYRLSKTREKLISNVEISLSSQFDEDSGIIRFETDRNVMKTVTIKVQNNCHEDIIELKKCEFLRPLRVYRLEDKDRVTKGRGTVKLAPGDNYVVNVSIKARYLGNYNAPLAFLFTKESEPDNRIHIVRFINARVSNSIVRELRPTTPYTRPPRVTLSNDEVRKVEEGFPLELFKRNALEQEEPLPSEPIPENLRRLLNKGFKHHTEMKDEEIAFREYLKGPLTVENHQSKFSILLHSEEIQMEVDIRKYDLEEVTMDTKGRLLVLRVPGLTENRPSVLKGDWLFARCLQSDGKPGNIEYKGYVHEVELNKVHLGFSEKNQKYLMELCHFRLRSKYIKGMKFNVRFTFNRLPAMLQHRAVKLAEEHTLTKLLFPTDETVCKMGTIVPTDTRLYLFDRKLESNAQQKAAVQHILAGSSRPAPYIVFGPPGTGKTVTIVEAIKQIHKNIPRAHVLACAPSNSAADLLASRLLVHIPPNAIYRLNASSRSFSTISDKVLPICNWNKEYKCFEFPEKKELQNYKIIVCTLVTAGRLASANFPADHFTHVFIDESGHAVEPEAIIPIAGILECDIISKDGAQVVLAGDPKQLGPVLRSPVARRHGLDVSFLERLMNIPVYKKQSVDGDIQGEDRAKPTPGAASMKQQSGNSEEKLVSSKTDQVKTVVQKGAVEKQPINKNPNSEDETKPVAQAEQGEYNPKLVTKLVKNYRSHPALLKLPNEMFYDNDLEPHADQLVRESLCRWNELPKKGFPLIFHGILGEDQREEKSPSFFNPDEVAVVVEYVEKLLATRGITVKQSDIGIISPYRKQVQKIQQIMKKKNWNNIQVGSTEMFQGQEKLIIIVSTVRSNPEYLSVDIKFKLGFLRNPKRFNVAVTRAKALMIVVGNPYMLAKDKQWNCLLEYCIENQAYVDSHCEYVITKDDKIMDDIIAKLADCDLNEKKDDQLPEDNPVEIYQDPQWLVDH